LCGCSGWPFPARSRVGHPRNDALTIVVGIVVVLVTIIGFFLCYQANRRGDDREFVVRFICMSWPIAWRMVAAFIPMLILLVAVTAILLSGRGQGSIEPIFEVLIAGLVILWVAAYYAIIRRWLIKISTGQVEASQTG
jgi:hypothetical protein